MKHENKATNNLQNTLEDLSGGKKASKSLFVLLLISYIGVSLIVSMSAGSHKVMNVAGTEIGMYAFAGVFSALVNILAIFMAVYFKKVGFISAIVLTGLQFPSLLVGIFKHDNLQSLPGVFTNVLTIIALLIIYINNVRIERFQEKIRDQAVTDRLTGLPNRFACRELVDSLLKQNERFAVVSIDLNNFKSINDTMGHENGNKVLVTIADRWKALAESGETGTLDFVTRQGDDEFTLIIRGYYYEKDIAATIKLYRERLEKKITIDDCDFYIRGSFGYAFYPNDTDNIDHLFTYADAAMHEVKRLNSSECILRFSKEQLKLERTLDIERKIRKALDDDSIFFELQPQYDMSYQLRGFEALARMKDADGNDIKPSEFIPVAEKVGLVDKVDLCVFRQSAKFFGELVRKTGANITLSINISVRHLMKNDFLDEVISIITSSGIPAGQLEIEITESVLIDSAEKALQCINEIKKMGIKIAIDDFGTGYSSLSYLYNFPADLLKVDKSFIDNMNTNRSSKQYVAAIISIGHIMKYDVISEGVEKEDQLETLKEIGCDYIQGFIWGRPLSMVEAENIVMSEVCK